MTSKYGTQTACRHCGQDIEFHGKDFGWVDRGGNRACVPYLDPKTREIVKPKTKHAPVKLERK